MKECEILIGGTNRPESKKFLSGLRSDDYGYALIGKKLVIAGRTEANTVKAIEAFEENVLSRFEKNGAAGTFMSSGDNYTFGAEYSVDSVDLCGTDIGKWTVVYPKKDTMGEAVAAERTRDIIASHCRFTVEVIRDDMAPADLENVISVGITAFTSDALADGLKRLDREQHHRLSSGMTGRPFSSVERIPRLCSPPLTASAKSFRMPPRATAGE